MIASRLHVDVDAGAPGSERLLVTGATGFIGHHVLAELLERGVPCAALLRPELAASTRRLATLLSELGVDLERHVAHGRLLLLEGDLGGRLPRAIGAGIGSVLHVAASTEFDPTPAGDPWRTNVDGTRHLLDWADERGIRSLHLVSSAFRCGIADGPVAETIDATEPAFHNVYERSKWTAERDAAAWAARTGATLTVHRPSIVVGDATTGRCTNFGGFYVMARAAEVLARAYAPDDPRRRETGVRIVGRPDAPQDFVPVDHVAAVIAHAVTNAEWHGGVYHLTHPDPPTSATVKDAIDTHFDIAGSGFVDPEALDPDTLTDVERLFHDASRPVRPYLVDTPTFERNNAARLERAAGRRCPRLDVSALRRLVEAARAAQWGRSRRRAASATGPGAEADDALIGTYFDVHLPRCLVVSQVARMTALTTTMRFVLRDVPDGAWWCRFVDGMLVETRRGPAPAPSDFTYSTTRDVFWSAVAGRVDPQRVFLDDRARISGDVEAAMKMAMILHRFNREFPCTPDTLRLEESRPCSATA